MVLDVEARDILARIGTWTCRGGPPVGLPLLLETRPAIVGNGHPGAEAVLSRQAIPDLPEGTLRVRDRGSALRPLAPGEPWAHVDVPPEPALPPSLADVLDQVPAVTRGEGGTVEVVHAAARRLAEAGPPGEDVELEVVASAAHLTGRPNGFVDALVAARQRAGPGRLLYVPGTANPRNLALLAYLGTDVVDDVQCHLEAARGRLLRPELGHLHDARGTGPGELARENLGAMRREVELVRQAVFHSSLRELVEVRVRSEPWQVAALRRLDRHHADVLLPACPVFRDRPLLALSRESLERVEVTAWIRRLRERYVPPASARVLVLLPCSARKPYSESRTHRRIHEALSGVPNRAVVHEVVLTSPLGAVPRELERTYPAAQYDIPVSGDWFPDELERMRELVEHIRGRGTYHAVVSHLGDGLPFLDGDPSVSRSREASEGALSTAGLRRLAEAVADAARDLPKVGWRERSRDDLQSLARFQFGPEAADALMRDARVEGRSPALRLVGGDCVQLAAVVPRRGLLSLTLAGAEALAATGRHRVWMDDFELRGDLFAVGVLDVDPGLRPEEEAVVLRGHEVVAVGVARMGGREMLAASRGAAVAVRHKRSGGEGA